MRSGRAAAIGALVAGLVCLAMGTFALRSAPLTASLPCLSPTTPTSTSTSAAALPPLARPSASVATSTSTSAALPPLARPAASAATSPSPIPDITDVEAAVQDRTAIGTQTLIAALDSADPIAVIEAADALVARRSHAGMLALAGLDLRKHERAALAVVDALGKLGAADPTNGAVATRRLLTLLSNEKARNAPESAAILLQIYEALGDTRDPAAAPALEGELADASVGDAAKVVIVGALARIGAPSSKEALERARTTLTAAASLSDPFDEAVRRELVSAIDAALAG